MGQECKNLAYAEEYCCEGQEKNGKEKYTHDAMDLPLQISKFQLPLGKCSMGNLS